MEFRKHKDNFTTKEKDLISKCLLNKEFKFTPYTTFRKQSRKITMDEIRRCLDNNKVIEIHIKDGDVRALLRGNLVEQVNINICVVVSLTTGSMITCYYNSSKDNHYNLDISKYISYLNIVDILKNTYNN